MKIIAVTGYHNSGVTLTSSILLGYINGKTYYIDLYDIVEDILSPNACVGDKDAIIHQLITTSPNTLINVIKARAKFLSNMYDYFIISDVHDIDVLNAFKKESILTIGVYLGEDYYLPYSIRDQISNSKMGEPDYSIENGMTVNMLRSKIIDLVKEISND